MRLRRERLSGGLFVAVGVGLAGMLVLFATLSARLNSLDDLKRQVRQQQQTIAALQAQVAQDRQDGLAQQRLVQALQAQVVQLCAGRAGCSPLTRAPAQAAPRPSAHPSVSPTPAARPTATRRPSPAPSPTGPVPSVPVPVPSPTLPVPSLTLLSASGQLGHGNHHGWAHRPVWT